jgi:hypothetical protein
MGQTKVDLLSNVPFLNDPQADDPQVRVEVRVKREGGHIPGCFSEECANKGLILFAKPCRLEMGREMDVHYDHPILLL